MGDHTECVQVDFDPAEITFDALLKKFWKDHNPAYNSSSCQYQNIVFYSDDEQKAAVLASVQKLEKNGCKIRTCVKELGTFTMAEEYHQQYLFKGSS